jgi:hypothetical protein
MQTPKVNPPPSNRRPRVGPLFLPAGGRKGPIPDWPLPGPQHPFETQLWVKLWAKPQAVVWEEQEIFEIVARYCRVSVLATGPDATAALMTAATMLEDRLGLTPRAMRMLLWQIAPDEVATARVGRSENVRERLRAVETG